MERDILTSEIPTLRISIRLDETVRFEKITGVSDSLWSSVTTWWNGVMQSRDVDSFEVPITDFSMRKRWLRTHWTAKGYNVSLDPEVIVTLKNIEQAISEFEALSEGKQENVTLPQASINLDGIIRISQIPSTNK